MLFTKQQIGRRGEDEAVKYLQNKGYEILGRNFKTKWGELDIVAKKKGVIVFVEVKTLRQKSGFFPEDAVDYKKRKQLLKMRQIYLSRNKLSLDTASQIDILAVEADNQGNVLDIRHWENAIEDVC